MDQLAWVFPLVAANRLGRLKRGELVEAEPPKDAAELGGRDAGFDGDLLAGKTLAAQGFTT